MSDPEELVARADKLDERLADTNFDNLLILAKPHRTLVRLVWTCVALTAAMVLLAGLMVTIGLQVLRNSEEATRAKAVAEAVARVTVLNCQVDNGLNADQYELWTYVLSAIPSLTATPEAAEQYIVLGEIVDRIFAARDCAPPAT